MTNGLNFTIEVAGCFTVCRHCWARGWPYHAMPFKDVAWVLELADRFCTEEGLSLHTFPMHEVLAHPQAVDVLKSFHAITGVCFEPIATTGVPLAVRNDWSDLLAGVKALGTHTLWLALHGLEQTHDQAVNRIGAFFETCLAIERAHAMGLRCGCNIFLTKESTRQFDQLVTTLQGLNIDEMSFEVAGYHPIARSRKHELVRPELDDLLPLAERIVQLSPFHRERWEHLEACTEAAYVAKALASGEADATQWVYPTLPDAVDLVCRPNLDIHSGLAGLYGPLHGNLRQKNVHYLLQSAIEYGPCSVDELHFSTAIIPSVHTLAEECGDDRGRKVYFHAADVRQRWLNIALAAYRTY